MLLVGGAFVIGLVLVAELFPDPKDGPTPGSTRFAVYVVFAALALGMAVIPLVVALLERRAGLTVVLGWRLVLAGGVLLAVTILGLGAWTWAYPPHNLTECFTAYHHDDGTGAFRLCEHGRVNRALGQARLDQGVLGGAAVALVASIAAGGLRHRSEKLGSDPDFP